MANGAVVVEAEGMGGSRSATVRSTVGVRRRSSSPSASGGWSGDIGGPLAAKAAVAGGSIVGSFFCVSSTTGIDGLGHDFDGGIVGRGRAERAIRPKDSASQSMTAVAKEWDE